MPDSSHSLPPNAEHDRMSETMDEKAPSPAPRLHTRATSSFAVKQEGRKPLFTANVSHEGSTLSTKSNQPSPKVPPNRWHPAGLGRGAARRTNSESHITRSTTPGSGTRIPRPGSTPFSHRKPMSLSEAYKLAQDEETEDDGPRPIDGSPSPAPRPWRARKEKGLSESPEKTSIPIKIDGKKTQARESNSPPERRGGLRDKLGLDRADTIKRDFGDPSPLPELVPGIEDVPFPSVENDKSPRRRQTIGMDHRSPEKGFDWQIDEDFTAGDLQVSDSPRLKLTSQPFANRLPFDENSENDIHSHTRVNNPGSQNTKLDEIRSREVKAGSNLPLERPRNTKLDDIRSREAEVAAKIPLPDRHIAQTNTKLDEIRQREQDGVPKKQQAMARLEEIREQNAMARSNSPEERRPRTSHLPKPTEEKPQEKPQEKPREKEARPNTPFKTGGDKIPDTPVTVYKSRDEKVNGDNKETEQSGATRPSHVRSASRDVLRRLARATSSSPVPEPEPRRPALAHKSDKRVAEGSIFNPRATRFTTNNGNARANGRREIRKFDKDNPRPTVEFAGLRRVRSSESTRSKRSSMHSESDPTDRIEAEMSLFAPKDDYSEKGSVRAPSPEEDDEEEEVQATPRPMKQDPLTMPTPRVTGAYVETPAPIRTASFEKPIEREVELKEAEVKPSLWGSADRDTLSDPGTPSDKETAITTAVKRPRARSLPRRRPPLKNTAKLPSVKDDIKQLQRLRNIEDSTLDDFEELLMGRKKAPPVSKTPPEKKIEEIERQLDAFRASYEDGLDLEGEEDDNMSIGEKLERKLDAFRASIDDVEDSFDLEMKMSEGRKKEEDEEEDTGVIVDRLSNLAKTALLGTRSAKQGIERLEGRVSSVKPSPSPSEPDIDLFPAKTVPQEPTAQSPMTHISIPIPRLFTRPFRLTPLGILTLLLSTWYLLETLFCALYCRPLTCSSPPCVWSISDPTTFGTALPIKLDQWLTHGTGRVLYDAFSQDAEDWMADTWDTIYGTDITAVDPVKIPFEKRRSWRRRMRKRGLLQRKEDVSNETKAVWESWRKEHEAIQRRREMASMGYVDHNEDEALVGGDERVW